MKTLWKKEKMLVTSFQPFPKQHVIDVSKLKDFADDIFKFNETGKVLQMGIENTVGKGEITSNFTFSYSVKDLSTTNM